MSSNVKHSTDSNHHPILRDDRLALIVQATSDGAPQEAIADKLGVNRSTVSRLLSKAVDILGARNAYHAIKLAERQGVLR